ncbi:hypothetical protein ACH4OW_26305 [Streptomyces sp. NPDC017056]|uniref:hypothetical protein n=1 Tax=Streptomyces sp. NPDC017056 TaxID=3364973 RepID=UPI0037999CD0
MPLPVALILAIAFPWLLASLITSLRVGSAGPLWLTFPARFWDGVGAFREGARRPAADYARIARLERELGIGNPQP